LAFHWRANDLSLTALTGEVGVLTRASDAGRTLKRGARHWKDAGYERKLAIGGADKSASWDWVLNASGVYEPALSLSGAFTNLVSSDDFNLGWTSVGTPVITSGVSDPAYGTGAYTIADDAGGAAEGKFLAFSYTGNAVKGALFVVKEATMASAGTQTLNVWDDIAGANVLSLAISAWVAGSPTVTATTGTYLGKRAVGNGFWAIFGQTVSVDATHAHDITIYPAATAAATGAITVYRANTFNALLPCPEILSASVARAADTLYWTFNAKPAAMSVYTKFVEQGSVGVANSRILQIGLTGAATDPRALISAAGGFYVGEHDNGTTDSTATLAAAPTYGQEVELLLTLSAAGLPTIYQGINGASPTSAAGSAAAFASAWAGTRLYLGCDPAGANQGTPAFRTVKVARGVKTMAEMREAL
jgi:hypothetical protein